MRLRALRGTAVEPEPDIIVRVRAVVVPIRGPGTGIAIVAPIAAGPQEDIIIRRPISIDFRP